MTSLSVQNKSTQNHTEKQATRLQHVDGLRGVAILLVVFYHAYADWSAELPYYALYADNFLFKYVFNYGYIGVQLFFVISGFVIAMTLEKCTSFGGFMYRRWLRLFPAMIIASLLIFVTAPLLTARPYGSPHLQDLIPGLTFIQPSFYQDVLSWHLGVLEIAFWTLFIEMKFYIIAGVLYFALGQKKMMIILVGLFLSTVALEFTQKYLPSEVTHFLQQLFQQLDLRFYGWFAAGAIFYQYAINQNKQYWLAALLLALLAARGINGLLTVHMLYATVLVLMFASALISLRMQKLLSNRFLVFFGFISYPLYLVHNQAMVSMVNQLHHASTSMPHYLLPLIPLLLVISIAWLIARYFEPALRARIKQAFTIAK